MSMTLTEVVLQIFAHVQTHQIVHIKVQYSSLYINHTSIKLLKRYRLQSPTCRLSLRGGQE